MKKFRVALQAISNTGVVFFALVPVEAEDQVAAVQEAMRLATTKGLMVTMMSGAPPLPCLAVAAIPLYVDREGDVVEEKPQGKIHLA